MDEMTRARLEAAFGALDALLSEPLTLILGGGTAMLLAYSIPVRTTDADAYPQGPAPASLDSLVKKVARQLSLPGDWLNPHFATFAHVLPPDYGTRLKDVFVGAHLRVRALGAEDLLVMKAFAGRDKDVSHARALLRRHPNLELVGKRLEELLERRIPGARDALDFFDDLQD
jgi:hypothetical protein